MSRLHPSWQPLGFYMADRLLKVIGHFKAFRFRILSDSGILTPLTLLRSKGPFGSSKWPKVGQKRVKGRLGGQNDQIFSIFYVLTVDLL